MTPGARTASRVASTPRWVTGLAVLCAVAALSCGSARPSSPSSSVAAVEATASSAAQPAAGPVSPSGAADSVAAAGTAAESAATLSVGASAAPRAPASAAVRVRIPALGVDAPILQMGVDRDGVMEIPQSSSTVAWYGFTAQPGSSGNAVMAGHVTWGGSKAVFYQLQSLRPGDAIEVQTGDGGVRYAVQHTYLVRPEEADIARIIGPRDGPQTLTLITCGGTFDASAREYDHRVIVFATRI